MTDIATFLDSLGLGRYTQQFIDNDIDISLLNRMSESHFKEIGMSLGHRLLLLDAIADQSTQASKEKPSSFETDRSDTDIFRTQGERRQLSVMFVDLVGSTSMSVRFDPEDLGQIVRSYQLICSDIVDQYQATIAKYSGDGILIYFGYPTAHENDVERSLRAGLHLIDAFRHREIRPGLTLQLRIGVATGLVVVGETIGEDSSEEQVVIGETPNLAARLQALAEPNTLVVSNRSHQLVKGAFDFTDLGSVALKGFSEPQQCWQVNSTLIKNERYLSAGPTATPRLLGRKEELDLLTNRWSWTCQGEGQTVLLGGEAGIGKSRILAEFFAHIFENDSDSEVVQLCHYCSDYHQNTFLYPVIDQCLHSSNISNSDSAEEKFSKLRGTLASEPNSQESDLTLIAELLKIPVENEGNLSSLTQQFKQNRTMEVLTEYYLRLAESGPVLLVFEDVHWADPSTLELIGRIKNGCTNLPVMLLLTYRSEIESTWKHDTNVTQLRLSRLPQRISIELVRDICQSTMLEDQVLQNITERADGIPLFIEELTKTVIGYAVEESAGENTEQTNIIKIPANEIPVSLQDSLLARLDKQASARRVAQIGSAFGKEFGFLGLKDLIDIDEQQLSQKLGELVDAEIIVIDGGTQPDITYRFKHSLVRDAAYESMLKSVRRQLHRRIAELLLNKNGFSEQSPEIIAEHWERSENYINAAELWFKAGKKSKNQFTLAEAISQLARVVNIAENVQCRSDKAISSLAARAIALQGDIAGLHGDGDQANRQYELALEYSQSDEISTWIRNKKHIPKKTQRDGATIAYDVHGNGSKTIVLGTAMTYGLGTLQPLLEEFGQDYRVITVHPRGCGNSDPVIRPYSITDHAEDLAAVIKSASDKPVIAIGLSRAANMLIQLVSKHKGLVSKLVTVGCPCKPEFGQGGAANSKMTELREKAYRERDLDSLVEMLHKRILTEPGTDELRAKSIELRRGLPEDTILSFFDPDPLMDITKLLPSVDIPVQIIHGAKDQQVILDAPHLMAKLIPDARLHLIEHAGHIPMITATQEFCELVKQFIDEEVLEQTPV